MSLWDIIRDFFVVNVFGGNTSAGVAYGFSLGRGLEDYGSNTGTAYLSTSNIMLDIGSPFNSAHNVILGISLGDWLSTTATIITLILLTAVMYLMVKWIFKVFAGLLR